MISFSIIIPVYNASKYIGRCIDSCLDQSYPSVEIICVDDCSNDESVSIINSYILKDSRVRLICHKANMSQCVARQTGVREAKNDYILFLDSDDYLDSKACSRLNKRLAKKPIDILQYGYTERPGNKKIFSESILIKEKRIKALLSSSNRYSPELWTKAYRKGVLLNALSKISEFYSTLAEDVFLSIVFAHNADTFGYYKKCLVNYSIGSGSTTIKNSTKESLIQNLECYKVVSDNIQNYIVKYCPEYEGHITTMRQYFIEDFIRNRLCDTLHNDELNEILSLIPVYFGRPAVLDYLKKQDEKSSLYDYWFSSDSSFLHKIKKITKYCIATLKGNHDSE